MIDTTQRSQRPDAKRGLGRLGERLAAEKLLSHGYRILERNFRCRCGEIDLVAEDGQDLVFVEVKTRRGTGYGLPREPDRIYYNIQWRQIMADFMESAKNLFNTAVSRTSWEAQKQLRVHSKQSEIDKLMEQRRQLMEELGQVAMNLYQQGALTDSQLGRLCASIFELDHDAKKREAQLQEIKNEPYPADQLGPAPTMNYAPPTSTPPPATPPPPPPSTTSNAGQSAGTQASRCPNCGSPLRPNALYCRNCGAKLR